MTFIDGAPVRRAAVTAVAHELRGHALSDGALGEWVDDEGQVRVAVDVDEPRRNDAAARIDVAGRLDVAEVRRDRDDAVAADPDITADRRRSGSVDDRAAAEDDLGTAVDIALEHRGGHQMMIYDTKMPSLDRVAA